MIDHTTLQPGMTFQHTGFRRKKLTTFVITKVSPSGVICHDEAEKGFDNKTVCCFPAAFWADKQIDDGTLKRC